MSTVEKGNELEDQFYNYLCDQRNCGALIYGAYAPQLCTIHKKKKYYCNERKGTVEFDVVIELSREGSSSPHLYVVFECKNHERSVQEDRVTDFSDKIRRIFGHAVKGVMVVSSRLQSGAENIAKNRNMGVVKYDGRGLDVVAERKGGIRAENGFVKSQIFGCESHVKALKFSAYHDGSFFGSIDQFLSSIDPSLSSDGDGANSKNGNAVPYISSEEFQWSTQELLTRIDYKGGPVDLEKICSELSLELTFTEQAVHDAEGQRILGSANFGQRSIQVNSHENKHRERFTIGHEIGHFYLRHDQYLRSETIVEHDLFINSEKEKFSNYQRLEFQANLFASDLLLPSDFLKAAVTLLRDREGMRDKGHGYIFVDDQPCNYGAYNLVLLELSTFFEVSIQAIEIKLKRMGLLTDQRFRTE